MERNNSLEITQNIKIIEWLKAEILSVTAELYMRMAKNADDDELGEAAANIIIATYILLNRLGISYMSLDLKIMESLKSTLMTSHNIELHGGDLSALLRHRQLEKK